MFGYIYKTTNLINNKIYIGQHIAMTFEPDKYIGSGQRLKLAINKYGIENFKNELICECYSQEELNEKEIYYINYYNSTDRKIGYNLTTGGQLNTSTTKGRIWVKKDDESTQILPEDLQYYLNNGWIQGRVIKNNPWNKGLTKNNSEKLVKQGKTRTNNWKEGKFNWKKNKDSWNYKTPEDLWKTINKDEFVDYWWNYGKCATAKKFHIRTQLVDRLLESIGLCETAEHKSIVYKNKFKNKNIS